MSHNGRFATAVSCDIARPFVKRCYFRFGSFASVWPRTDDFRSTPINRHRYRASACLKCANNGKDQACIGDKRAIMCADCAYALPDDHEPRNIATDKHAQSVR